MERMDHKLAMTVRDWRSEEGRTARERHASLSPLATETGDDRRKYH